MDLNAQLLKVHNRENADLMANWVGTNQERFDRLLDILVSGDFKLAQRASWPLSISGMKHPFLVQNHLEQIIVNLKRKDIHNGVRRNTLNLFVYGIIPEILEGELMNLCFNYVADPLETAAIKSSSLGILEKLSKKYPEILPELKMIIQDQHPYEATSFKTKGRRILKRQSSGGDQETSS